MKADLHVHSEFSKRPSTWLLKKVGCSESYTDPLVLYRCAKERGMTAVTITDHNCIDGCREIAHLPDAFIGCEVTSYFPEDGCKIHILVYRISEAQFSEIDALRENVYELIPYLKQQQILYVLAHPLHKVNDLFTADHLEKCILLFKHFELNGDHEIQVNHILRQVLNNLDKRFIDHLANKHEMEPVWDEPWQKSFTAGSDDHSSLTISYSHTQVPGAKTIDQYLTGLHNGKTRIHCPHPATPLAAAHNFYGVAYQFYNAKFKIGRHHERSVLIRFLDRMLQTKPIKNKRIWNRMVYHWKRRKNKRIDITRQTTLSKLLQYEAQRLIESDHHLKSIMDMGHTSHREPDVHWFRFVNEISNKMLEHFGSHIVSNLTGGNPFDLFHTIGSGGALYTLLAPYFVSHTMYSHCRRFSKDIADHFKISNDFTNSRLSVAHFTDTFYEINGVARMLQEELMMAQKMGKDLTMITCLTDESQKRNQPGLRCFDPVAVHALPEYPEVKTAIPPLLKIMNFCYQQEFTHIHAATPGPLGLCAVAVSKILQLPLFITYHTSIPQYARYLTGDSGIEELAWRYILWFYDQADIIFSPSASTSRELVAKGISKDKIRIIPRGVDTKLFNPDNRCDSLNLPKGLKLLYVGRVSKEKDLPLLVNVFKRISKKITDVSLVIVGDGPYLEEMKLALKGYPCVFTGYLTGEQLVSIFPKCDVFVFPSTTDTFGNVVLEAQASGLPVIVTDQGGPCENVIASQTGLVVPGGDENAFYNAVETLLSDPQQRIRMGQRANEYAGSRDFHKAFEEYWHLYSRIGKTAAQGFNIQQTSNNQKKHVYSPFSF